MTVYNVNKTDSTQSPIEIDEEQIDNSTNVTLFGRKRLQYGADLNENLLRLLENFACPEDSGNPGNPDLSRTKDDLLTNTKSLNGQLWYNPSQIAMFYHNDNVWTPFSNLGDIGANWGVILDGATVPLPVSSSGYAFSRSECSWVVGPFNYSEEPTSMVCETDANGVLTMQYNAGGSLVAGYANFLIVGIRDNNNQGSL